MATLVFNEEAFLTNNIGKFESRIKSQVSKYIENGAILTTYYHIYDNEVTVDRGLRDIAEIFGRESPLLFNRVDNFPLYGFGATNPQNTEEQQVEDINVDGECILLPSTIVPNPNDFFTVNHLKMLAIFQVAEVSFDAMKVEGYYKIRYRLFSTSPGTMEELERQVIARYRCQLDALGTDLNPIIAVDDAMRRDQITKIVSGMIDDYRALFYSDRHNCFLCRSHTGDRWFDHCGNEFIAKHSLMNVPNSNNVIMLQHKLIDAQFPQRYQRSVYRWVEDDAPIRGLQNFFFDLEYAHRYRGSSFYRWSEFNVKVIQPVQGDDHLIDQGKRLSVFNSEQVNFFADTSNTIGLNEYDNLIKLYVSGKLTSTDQISLNVGNVLSGGISDTDNYFLTPIIIFIIRKVLSFN